MNSILQILRRQSTTVAIVTLGLLARLLYLLSILHQPLSSDAASYNRMAAALAQGQHFVPYWPPALPLYLAAVTSFCGSAEFISRLAMLPFYLLLSYALYRTVLHLTQEPAWAPACANLALVPIAFAPGMICLSLEPVTEMPSAALLMVVACVLLGFTRGNADNHRVGLASCVLGLAIGSLALLRPASLILLLFAPFYLAWRTKSRLAGLLVCLIPAVMVIAWICYVHATTGSLVPINTANARNFYLGNNPGTPLYRTWWQGSHVDPTLQATATDAEYSSMAKAYIRQHPGLFLLRSFNRICVFFAPDTYVGAYQIATYGVPKLVGLAIIAIDSTIYTLAVIASMLSLAALPTWKGWLFYRNEKTLQAALLLALILLYASPYFVAFSHPRYHFPIEPLLIAYAAAFAVPFFQGDTKDVMAQLRKHRCALVVAIAVLLAIQIEFVLFIVRAGLG